MRRQREHLQEPVAARTRRLLLGLAAALAAAAAPAQGAPASGPEVVLCEPHDRVLVHWLRAAREGRLPRSGVTVIHFDAHPDLSVPQGPLPRGFPDDVRPLLAASNIASFQLAAVWAGLVSRIVWIRPEFAGEIQLPDGARRFRLGETESGALRVDDRSDHYVLDGAYAPTSELRGAVEIEVEVLPLSAALRRGPLATGPVILDVDLDGFATHNPGARRLREAGLAEADLETLRDLFSPTRLALAEDPVQRVRDLDAVLGAVGSLAQRRFREWPGALPVLYRSGVGLGGLARLAAIAWRVPDGLEPERFLEDGRLLVSLPERTGVAPAEIEATASALAELLRSGAVRPALVTVARSVEDGYTPREEWPRIEWTLLRALAGALGSAPLRLDDGVRPAPRAD